MDRRKFIQELKTPLLATCAICLGACTKEEITPDGGSNQPNGFKVDLTKDLQTVGSFVSSNALIVVRLAASNVPASFSAVQRACPHQGTNVNWVQASSQFVCPNHGARFNTKGQNVGGQRTDALTVYTITVEGTTLTVA